MTAVRDSRNLTKCFKVLSVYDFKNETKDDHFQYEFAKKNGFTLVTLDRDFMNDGKFPINKIPGIIVILAGKNDISRIIECLNIIVSFIAFFPLPKSFIGDSKFQVSLEGCVMRGRDAKTRQLRTIAISPGDSMRDVAEAFHYFG